MKFLQFSMAAILMMVFATTLMAQNSSEGVLIEQAVKLLADKKYSEARDVSNTIIKLNPSIPRSYNIRGLTYMNEAKFDLAIADFNQALTLDPNYKNAYYNRAYVYDIHTNQPQLAVRDYTNVLKIDPSHKSALYMRALIYYTNLGEYDSAIEDFKKSIELNPDDIMADMYVISVFIRTQRYAEAKQYFDRFLQKKGSSFIENNRYWNFYKPYVLASGYMPKGDYIQALSYLEISIKEFETANPDNCVFWDLLAFKGFVLEKLNRSNEAKEAYEQSIAISKNQPDVLKALANLNKRQQVIAKADNIPPVIELLTPQPSRGFDIVSAKNETQIIGRAKDPSGIASIKINGVAIKAEEDGLFISSLMLKAGTNQITVLASDKQGNTATKTFTVIGNAVTKKETDPEPVEIISASTSPVYHAILIAEKDYTDPAIADLENPVKDATELKQILENNYTFSPKNIQTLYNKTREEIMQTIIQKSNALTENDNLLIFYAGHGIAEKDRFGDVDGYWVPSSAKKGNSSTYISAHDINTALRRSVGKHILVVADACFSGAFTRELGADASVGIQKQFAVPSRKIMASGNLEPVPDNSKFIFYLKKNLKDNKEKYLTAKKLFDSFYEAILNNSDTSPQYAAIKNVGDEGGEFVFIKK